jgi:hypothetical protein
MADILTSDERAWLLDALGELIDARGAKTFLSAPILEPTPRDFPDPFEPNESGVRTLLKRIMRHAGLAQLEVDVDTFSQPDVVHELDERGGARSWGHDGAAAWFAGIGEDGCCHFGVAEERIRDPEALVATLCHEVAHAWRTFHAVRVEERDEEERLTDLTTVYLGFGLLTTNGAYRYRQCGSHTGTHSVLQWSHGRAGYLPPQAMSFLLAAQVKARGLGWLARRRIAGRLETNQASYFAWAYRNLPPHGELRRALGLTAVDLVASAEE